MTQYNLQEIFETAEQIERSGAAFYRKAADAAGGKVQGILNKLAEMEDLHERRFADLRARLPEGPGTLEFDQPDALAYIDSLAAGKIFRGKTDPAAALTGKETPAQVLQTAITLEKDSVVFYLGLQPLVVQAGTFKEIEKIIWEEMGHITTLSNLLTAISDQ